eukprot:TRINITY_DN55790_c0_g1_i1.p1 TRINITY_DN55790_c0_g1~~TRINITY_DN55790_c0_g1_i1.p1  ORF type:complete len:665 (+),score=113.52 TRINITY_DN55790_c0_g1_i1:161-2155(+)
MPEPPVLRSPSRLATPTEPTFPEALRRLCAAHARELLLARQEGITAQAGPDVMAAAEEALRTTSTVLEDVNPVIQEAKAEPYANGLNGYSNHAEASCDVGVAESAAKLETPLPLLQIERPAIAVFSNPRPETAAPPEPCPPSPTAYYSRAQIWDSEASEKKAKKKKELKKPSVVLEEPDEGCDLPPRDSKAVSQASVVTLPSTPGGRNSAKRNPIFMSESSADHVMPRTFSGRLRRFVEHNMFESVFASIILLNSFLMAAEVQYIGIDIGFMLGFRGHSLEARQAWPGASTVFDVLGWVFGLAFTLEVALKVIGLRKDFLFDMWNYIDSAIVFFWILSIFGTSALPINAQSIRLARLARLLRLLRLFKTIQGFDALFLMTTALKGSLSVLGWACVLLFVVQLMVALFLNQVLSDSYFLNDAYPLEERAKLFEYFGTFSRSMLSMFEITLANWPPICRLLSEQYSEYFMILCVLHKLTIGFAVVGVINGVFMQETFKVASTDDRIMVRQKETAVKVHRAKMQLLFEEADKDGSGKLDLQEFIHVLGKPNVRTWLTSMELDTSDAVQLHNLLDEDHDGVVTMDELIRGTARLKGAARSFDLLSMVHEVRDTLRQFRREADLQRSQSMEAAERNNDFRWTSSGSNMSQLMEPFSPLTPGSTSTKRRC